MMKSILLCEGKSDAILISYYLNKTKGWEFSNKKDKRKITIPVRNQENEEVKWYSLNDDLLVIWGVGGKDNLRYSINEVLKNIRFEKRERAFDKIVILRDRDNTEDIDSILQELSECLDVIRLENNNWNEVEYINEFNDLINVKILPIIIPFNKHGALETFLLEAITEMGEEESLIVNKSKEFISNFRLAKYLFNERLKLKGELAVTLGTMFPQKTFTPIDYMLKDINWEEYRTIQEGFRKLEEI